MQRQENVALVDSLAAYRYSLNHHVFEWLRNQIITMQDGYRPGDRLNAQTIGATVGVSKTPVVYAINQLATIGLVVIRPRSGTYVANPAAAEVHELFQFIAQLEMASIRLAPHPCPSAVLDTLRKASEETLRCCQAGELGAYLDADRSFHSELGGLAVNGKLRQAHIAGMQQAYLALAQVAQVPGSADRMLAQHGAVIEALAESDWSAVEAAILRHWDDTWHGYTQMKDTGEEGGVEPSHTRSML
jgi:DNA-binding GntR family transcriptional regulator